MAPPSPPILNSVPKARPTTLQFWWDPPTTGPVTGYRLQCIAAAIDVSVSSTTRTYQFTGLTDATTYQFQIQAYNNDGYSDPAYFMPAQPGVISGPPTNVTATTTDGINTTVSWTAPTTPLNIGAYWVTAIPSDAQSSNDYIIKTAPSNETSVPLSISYISTPSQTDKSYTFNVRAFTSPGWSAQSAYTSTTLNSIYGSYATNMSAMYFPITDSQGNQWICARHQNTGIDINLYNRFGTLVQTIPSATIGSGTNIFIVYISADGYSNLWIARLSGVSPTSTVNTGVAYNFAQRMLSAVDSQGNLVMVQSFQLSGATPITFFDKNNTLVRTISISTGTTPYQCLVLKISPTGVWSGNISDPNTWLATIQTTTSAIQTVTRPVAVRVDNQNNIVLCINTNNGNTSPNTLVVYDKAGNIIGSHTFINGDTAIVKYNSDGSSTNSWRAYISTNFSQVPLTDSLKINKYNQIIAAVRYRDAGRIIGSDNLQIGETLPFSSTMGTTSSFTESCLIRFCSSGISATSWRAVQFSSTLGLSKMETPHSVHIDSGDNIIYTSYSEGLSTNIRYFACGSTNTTSISTLLDFNNICMMKYTNLGRLEWLTLLRGNSSAPILTSSNTTWFSLPNGFNNSSESNTTNQQLFTVLDQQDNLVLYGVYFRGGFDFVNAVGQVVGSTGRTITNNLNQTFVAKLSTNTATNGWLAMQGWTAAAGIANTNETFGLTIDNSNHIVIVGRHQSTTMGFYVNSNVSTAYIRPQGFRTFSNATSNVAISRYDPFLSTVSSMVFTSLSTRGSMIANSVNVDTNNNIIIQGTYLSSVVQYDWFTSTNTRSTLLKAISTSTDAQNMFIANATNNSTLSWMVNIGNTTNLSVYNTNVGATTGIGNSVGFYPTFPRGYTSINRSTNRIFFSANASTNTQYIYDRFDNPIVQLGRSGVSGGSNYVYFASYTPNAQ